MEQLDLPLSWEDLRASEEERKLMQATLEEFTKMHPNDKLFNWKWGRLSFRDRVKIIDWTNYLNARQFCTEPCTLVHQLRLKRLP